MMRAIMLTGFAPFGGERMNPSWEVAKHFDGAVIGGLAVEAVKLPVNCSRAARIIVDAIDKQAPAALLGLGQAGGRPALSLEKVAINLADNRASREVDGGLKGKPVVANGPDAYFSRLPLASIIRALKARGIPAGLSLTAGAFVCNSVMYAGLHALRRHRGVPAGFIHLPYDARQAVRHRAAASMSLEMMMAAVEIALKMIAREAG